MEVVLATSLLLREPDPAFVPSEPSFALGTPAAEPVSPVSGLPALVDALRGVGVALENSYLRIPRHCDPLANVQHHEAPQSHLFLCHPEQSHGRHSHLYSPSDQVNQAFL